MNKKALIFGYNKYSLEIAINLEDICEEVVLYTLDEVDLNVDLPVKIRLFDLSDEWNDIDENVSMVFCVLDEVAQNIFLTISLRANFKDLKIIALSSDKESATKLKMAGANKVIPLVETTADIIANMLEKPISNKILHDILYNKSNLKIAQIKIGENSNFKDEQLSSIDWTRYNGIIVLSVVHEDMSSEFIYSSKANRHILQAGDMLVVVGYEEDIEFFEKKIGSERYVDWSHWSW